MGEQVNGWMGEQVNGWIGGSMGGWMGDLMGERASFPCFFFWLRFSFMQRISKAFHIWLW